MQRGTRGGCDTLPQEVDVRTYWSTCPMENEFYPETPCGESCDWGITDSNYNHCFWTYIRCVSDHRGFEKALFQLEIGSLLGIPGTKVAEEYKQAMAILESIPEYPILKSLFEE